MAQTKHEIQSFLSAANTQPRHRFGQNFMIDRNLVRVVADAGQIAPGDVVIEVGPGTGTQTEELLSRGVEVIAVEIDRGLAKLLRERYESEPRFTLIEGDALSSKHALNQDLLARFAAVRGSTELAEVSTADSSANPRPIKLVANLPYNIASPLVLELLILGTDLLAFTVQKEVADRLRAGAGSDAYGPLSVMAQLLARVEVLRTLPPQAFWPAPKIESALVRITRSDQLGGAAADFSRFLAKLFSFRRKTLRRALAQSGFKEIEDVLARLGMEAQKRPEEFEPGALLALYRAMVSPAGG
jgi:16S rRNA (adenine1518-N6/adenine1519-N6)-dimethyltransferase